MFAFPVVADFKAYFVRDFPYGTDVNANVLDQDIANAQTEAQVSINQALFPDQNTFNLGFNLFTAHTLVVNLRASSQGISGQFAWLQSGHSVGNVSEAFAIPERVQASPMYAYLTKTNYGAKYLNLIFPNLIGVVSTAHGRTNA